ncbi:1036_t:CDS:2, partial [Gigaspora rosea]
IVQLKEKREFSRQLAIVLLESGTTDYGNCEEEKSSNKGQKDNERESNQKEKTEEASNLTTRIIQEALISDINKNAISKRKKDPDLLPEDANKQAPTLTETAIAIGTRRHNNIHDKKDTLRGSLSDKTNIGSKRSKPSKSFNLGSKPKHVDKENISQTDLLQEILERLN